jgi:hypothetical protein
MTHLTCGYTAATVQRMKARTFLASRIVEPFPVFYSHVSYPSESRRETAKGPFYGANSVTYHPTDAKTRAWLEWCKQGLAERGWTMLVTEETR